MLADRDRRSPQGRGGVMDVIDELIAYCEAWEPWARVMGNVCAGDAAQALRNLCAELETEESRRHEVVRERNALRDELAESKKEIALLKTPNLVWDFDDPENSAVDSVADAVYQHIDWWGDINVGDVMTFLTARKLSNVTIRITSVNDDGEVTFEAIDAAMAGGGHG